MAREVALSLAGVKDVTAGGVRGQIPRRVSLVELLGLEELSPSRVAERWERAGDGVDAPVGQSAGGPFVLDMRADGPHDITHRARLKNLKQTRICAHVAFESDRGAFDVFNTHLSLPNIFAKAFWTEPRRLGYGKNQLEEAKQLADFVTREAQSPNYVIVGTMTGKVIVLDSRGEFPVNSGQALRGHDGL